MLVLGAATGTIADDDGSSIIDEQNDDEQGESAALELAALQVTGGASATYPAFAADIHHYALTCHDATTLRVTAQASSSAVRLTLLRDDPAANHTSAGSLDVQVNVNRDHDIAIELGAVGGGTGTYVVHCLSSDFPDIVVLTKAEDVSEGLLFMAPRYRIAGGDWLFHMAIVDNNGVPRFHRALDRGAMDFRPVRHPIAVNGQEVRYLLGRTLFSKDLQVIEAEIPWSANKNNHDFQITEHGTFVGINQESVNRDFSDFTDSDGNPYSVDEPVHDSVIREYPMSGPIELVWRSWTHRDTLQLSDCQRGTFPDNYAFINSIQFIDDGIVASSRGCAQVIRIERAGFVYGDAVRQRCRMRRAEEGSGAIHAGGRIRHFVGHGSEPDQRVSSATRIRGLDGGVAALLQLGEGGTGRRHLGHLELEQVHVAGGAHGHVQAPVAARLLHRRTRWRKSPRNRRCGCWCTIGTECWRRRRGTVF